MVESISDYYRRRASEERQFATQTPDIALQRIHLDKAARMERRAQEVQRSPL